MIDVHWLEQSAADVPLDDDWLGAREAERLSTLRFPKRRADWRLGRWTAKRGLACYLGERVGRTVRLSSIEILAAPSGAPEAFVDGVAAAASLSLSHRDGLAFCAIAQPNAALGCDLEVVEARSDAFVADYFTAAEQTLISTAPAANRPLLVPLLWSAKESALKVVRTGLRDDTRSVEVRLPADFFDTTNTREEQLDDLLARTGWQPLEVQYCERDVFHGWWRRDGMMIRTLVATPSPQSPHHLSV
jgi:4'-phosphopantetheinyl transferase